MYVRDCVNLNKAKKMQDDEFYTQFSDIEAELQHYKDFFKDKTIFCNCDNPYTSNFVKYFVYNFNKLSLKRLIATCYSPNIQLSLFADQKDAQLAYKLDLTEVKSDNYEDILKQNPPALLNGDGDFRSSECLELLKQADIIATNPPFSSWRDFVGLLFQNKKQFVILGHHLSVQFPKVFAHLAEQKMWLGTGLNNKKLYFERPSFSSEQYAPVTTNWYTNIPVEQHYSLFPLTQSYSPDRFPRYDNFDAIEVNKAADIPLDFDGIIGVPVSFLKYWNPQQFDIVGCTSASPPYQPVKNLFVNGQEVFGRVLLRHKKIK